MVVKFEQRGWTPRERAFKLSIKKTGSTKKFKKKKDSTIASKLKQLKERNKENYINYGFSLFLTVHYLYLLYVYLMELNIT